MTWYDRGEPCIDRSDFHVAEAEDRVKKVHHENVELLKNDIVKMRGVRLIRPKNKFSMKYLGRFNFTLK